jgi:Cupin
MLLAGLPALVRVNVRGSNAGIWLEGSVRYALAEARSPRPSGAGVLAKLAEVLFIEVLRLRMNEQGEVEPGWLAGVGDRIVGPALNALYTRPAHAWTLEELARHQRGAGADRLATTCVEIVAVAWQTGTGAIDTAPHRSASYFSRAATVGALMRRTISASVSTRHALWST